MNKPTCSYCNITYDHEIIGYHIIKCQNKEYYNCPYFDCKQKKNFKKFNLIKHLNNKHFKQITKIKSNICLEDSLSQSVNQLLKKYAFDNKLSDKTIINTIDLIEDIAKLTKSYDLITCLKKCSIKKEIKEKNLKVVENNELVPISYYAGRHSNPNSYIRTIREEVKIMFIDVKNDLKNHIIQNNLINYIDGNSVYVILYLDDVNFFKDSTKVPKKGMITNMAYRLVLSKNEFIKPLITSSTYEYLRTFGLCLQKHSKLSMYEREIRFAVKKFKDLQLSIFDKTFSVKVHALIGDHVILQDAYKRIKNFKCRGNTPVCRCCKLLPSEYKTIFLSEKVEKFLRNDVIHPDLNKGNELYSDYFHDCAEGIYADTVFAVVNLFLVISDESSFEFSKIIRDISKNVCKFSLHHVITDDFFFVSKERKFVYKKNRFSLTGAQQIELVFVIYNFLKSYTKRNSACSPIILCFNYLLQSFVNLHLYMTDITRTTDEIIEKIDGIVDSIQVNIRVCLPGFSPTYKSHFLNHYKSMICALGHPYFLNTMRFEASNKILKDISRISKNKRKIMTTTLGKMHFFANVQRNNKVKRVVDNYKNIYINFEYQMCDLRYCYDKISPGRFNEFQELVNYSKNFFQSLIDNKKILLSTNCDKSDISKNVLCF